MRRVSEILTTCDPSGAGADFLIGGCQEAARGDDRDDAEGDADLRDDARHDDDDCALVFYHQEADWRKPIPGVASTPPTNPANTK